jgi:hypothetical protein
MQAAAAAGASASDSGSESDRDMDSLRDAVNSAVGGRGNSIAVSAGNGSSAAGQLEMRHNIHYDVTQFVTDYDAINVFGLMWKDLKGLKYQKRYIPGVCRQGMRLNVSQTALCLSASGNSSRMDASNPRCTAMPLVIQSLCLWYAPASLHADVIRATILS